MSSPALTLWPGLGGNAAGCREKLKMFAGNHAEVLQVLQDAVLMGVDEQAMRQVPMDIAAGLDSPKRPCQAAGMKPVSLLAAALLMHSAVAMAERPPIQALPSPQLTPQVQVPSQLPDGNLKRPLPGLERTQPYGVAPGQILSGQGSPGQVLSGPGSAGRILSGPNGAGQILSGQAPQGQVPVQPSEQALTRPEDEVSRNPGGSRQDQPATSSDTAQQRWPSQWVSRGNAKIQALDKVNAQATTLTMKVGQPAAFGSLTITVKACVIRPPDQPADAAAFLDVTDSHPESPGFDGWMLANEPSVSMMQNPIYDLRVAGCG